MGGVVCVFGDCVAVVVVVCVFAFLLALVSWMSTTCGVGLSRFRLLHFSVRLTLAGALASRLAPFFVALV